MNIFWMAAILVLSPAVSFASMSETARRLGNSEFEGLLLKKYLQVKRDGPTLRIEVGTTTVQFVDNPANGEGLTHHYLIAAFPIDRWRTDFVVQSNYWEGNGFTLVNGKTGKSLKVAGEPSLSPSMQDFLITSFDIEAGYNTNEVSIIKAWDYSPEFTMNLRCKKDQMCGPFSATWLSSDEVFVLKKVIERKKTEWLPPEEVVSFIPVTLKREQGKWVQHEGP